MVRPVEPLNELNILDILGIFIFSPSDEFKIPEMTVRRPFSKLYLGHKAGPQPVAVFYFVSYDGSL